MSHFATFSLRLPYPFTMASEPRLCGAKRARAEFFLSRAHLRELQPALVRDGGVRMYDEDTLRKAALKIHGESGIRMRIRQREAQVELNNTRGVRAQELAEKLRRFRLSLRSDSTLCQQYINLGVKNGWTAEFVAERMAQMHFLHTCTNYIKRLSELRSVRYGGDLAKTAEDSVVRVLGGFPARWPWLSETWSRQDHDTYPQDFRERVRTLLLCLCRVDPRLLFATDAVVGHMARSRDWDVTPLLLPPHRRPKRRRDYSYYSESDE